MTPANRSACVVLLLAGSLASSIRGQACVHTHAGSGPRHHLGSSVAGLGDVNQDRYSDYLVGARRDDGLAQDAGAVYLYSGADGSLLRSHFGEAAADEFGACVAAAGDVNSDGCPDYVVGAPFHDLTGSNAGAAYVYSGLDGASLYIFRGGAAEDQCGHSVGGGGDVNQDGYDDVLVGAPLADDALVNAGRVEVRSGCDGQLLHTFLGSAAQDSLGWSVAGGGDMDADGYDDIIIGILGEDSGAADAGAAVVFSGQTGSVWQSWLGSLAGMGLGHSVGAILDLNQDGHDEVIVGAPLDPTAGIGSGSAVVYCGQSGAVLFHRLGDSPGDLFGWAVSEAGDLNADGTTDWLVGAHRDDNGVPEGGSARLFSGTSGATLYTLDGVQASESLGQAVCAAGDVDGDGRADVLVGEPLTSIGGNEAGRAKVYSGSPLYLEITPKTLVTSQLLSLQTAVAPIGTVALLFVTAVNGVPIFSRLPIAGFYNAQGKWGFSFPVPSDPTLDAGVDLQFQVVASGPLGVQFSNRESVRFN
jgi:hypothetical protein